MIPLATLLASRDAWVGGGLLPAVVDIRSQVKRVTLDAMTDAFAVWLRSLKAAQDDDATEDELRQALCGAIDILEKEGVLA